MASIDTTASAPSLERPGQRLSVALGDERLARLAARGDRRAVERIFERYQGELYRYCQAILGNAHDAQDAVQATMVAVLRALPGETREIALRPWLYRVAHNESISLIRRREQIADPEQALADATVHGADGEVEGRERLRSLVADLSTLPDRQRGALVLRELSDMSYAEIAAALVTSEATARQTVYEARVALRDLEEGREMSCHDVRRQLSERDGRIARGRKIRSHLRSCEGCRDFRAGIDARRSDLRLLNPLAPAAAAAVLTAVLAEAGIAQGAGAGAAVAAGGGVAGATGLGGGATGAGGAIAIKAASVVAAVALGAGAADVTGIAKLPLIHGGSSLATHPVGVSHEGSGARTNAPVTSSSGQSGGSGNRSTASNSGSGSAKGSESSAHARAAAHSQAGPAPASAQGDAAATAPGHSGSTATPGQSGGAPADPPAANQGTATAPGLNGTAGPGAASASGHAATPPASTAGAGHAGTTVPPASQTPAAGSQGAAVSSSTPASATPTDASPPQVPASAAGAAKPRG